jgi:hypothetical protein
MAAQLVDIAIANDGLLIRVSAKITASDGSCFRHAPTFSLMVPRLASPFPTAFPTATRRASGANSYAI